MNTLTMITATTRRALALKGSAKKVVWDVARKQIFFTGVDAIPLIAFLGAAVGILVIVQSVSYLPQVGAARFMGDLFVLLILRELGPILVAFVVIARSGTAIAAELGTMTVRGEMVGMMGVGVDPLTYMVWPRMVGAVTAVMGLTVIFISVAFVAGFGMAAFMHISAFGYLFDTLFRSMALGDIAMALGKTSLMAVAVAGVAARQGLSAEGDSTDVPRRTLAAVVNSFTAVVAIEAVVMVVWLSF